MAKYYAPKYAAIRLHERSTFINDPDDMRWLREVHLPRLPKRFKSALLIGNEDSSDVIQVYRKKDPSVYDEPKIYLLDVEAFAESKGLR